MSNPGEVLEVWLDGDMGPPCLVGTLAHDRGQIRFRYERTWLADARAFALDPDLSLDDAPFFPNPELGRRFYASAMTLLRKNQSEGCSYLELAQFLRSHGDGTSTDADLEQLFRRVAFNVAVGNRDDHLRNHGFMLGKTGWRLAPAFDVNPNIDKAEHVLNIDDVDNRPSLQTVLTTAAFYGLSNRRAGEIMEDVVRAVDGWNESARRAGISRADIELTSMAFSAHSEYRHALG